MEWHGWIILDKPEGMSSAQAVAKVKRLLNPLSLRERAGVRDSQHSGIKTIVPHPHPHPNPLPRGEGTKIGHAGTLDPLASGVLPLALGEATKTVPYMMDAEKAYAFTVTWGEERDTDDREGQVTAHSDKRPSQQDIEAILPQFIGRISQIPPAYSALKIDGKRAYELARAGDAPQMQAREVRVDSLSALSHRERDGVSRGEGASTIPVLPIVPHPNPLPEGEGITETAFLCHCGKGTYIRSLGRDMGRKLGCFGYISHLRRLKVGKFNETHAISLEMLEIMVHKGDLSFLHPVESALDDILARDIEASQATRLRQGQRITLAQPTPDGMVRVRHNDTLMALGEALQGVLKPVRVFNL